MAVRCRGREGGSAGRMGRPAAGGALTATGYPNCTVQIVCGAYLMSCLAGNCNEAYDLLPARWAATDSTEAMRVGVQPGETLL